jgi:hypothetical protein
MFYIKESDKDEQLKELQKKCDSLIKSNKKLALIIIKEWSKVNFLYNFPAKNN